MAKVLPTSRNPSTQAAKLSQGSSSRVSRSVPSRARPTEETGSKGASRRTKTEQNLAPSKPKNPSPENESWKVHEKCLDRMDEAEEDLRQLRERIRTHEKEAAQSLQQLRNENAQEKANALQMASDKAQALSRSQELEKENRDLKHQLEIMTTNIGDQVSWNEVQPILQSTRNRILSAANEVGNTLDAFHNKRLAANLPDPGVFWSDQTANLGMCGSNSLPGYPLPVANVPPSSQHMPVQHGQFASLP